MVTATLGVRWHHEKRWFSINSIVESDGQEECEPALDCGPRTFADGGIGVTGCDDLAGLPGARRNAEQAGVANVEFLHGTIEAIPRPPRSVDVVISTCVINLSGDKAAVPAEAFRVPRPSGRFGVSDVVADGTGDPMRQAAAEQRIGSAAGALSSAGSPPPRSPPGRCTRGRSSTASTCTRAARRTTSAVSRFIYVTAEPRDAGHLQAPRPDHRPAARPDHRRAPVG
ncbi:methyltransferase domain-containing protein [Nonomuraea typhae]|uniref:methyltransferase domain-containing protein n=1 Tax=Nonomuraea typhae TaxID=2603600 RepID=UPI001CA478CF